MIPHIFLITFASAIGGILIAWMAWYNYIGSYDASFIYLLDGVVMVAGNHTFSARPATFGPLPPLLGSSQPLEAPLTPIAGFGCQSGDLPDLNNSIALVIRGGCPFYQKIAALQDAGAQAVIVGNNQDSNLVSMYSPDYAADVFIPSVFVNRYAFEALHKYERAEIALLPQSGSLISSIALFVLSPLLSISLVYAALAYQRYRDRVRLRAPKHVLDAMPVYNWEELDTNPILLRDCAICLEDFDKQSKIMLLPCNHGFHVACVSRWLLRERSICPICRKSIVESA